MTKVTASKERVCGKASKISIAHTQANPGDLAPYAISPFGEKSYEPDTDRRQNLMIRLSWVKKK